MSDTPVCLHADPAPAGRPGFVPLSDQLESIINSHQDGPGLSLNDLLSRTADRGPFGLIILLCLPFLGPVSLPGVSNVFGVVILLLAWRIYHGQPPRLPGRVGARSIEGRILAKVIRASIRVLRWVERMTKPRGSPWIRSGTARRFNALVLMFGGILLAAPIPPIIPLSNLTPSVGIMLVAASMMEEDGVVIWFGYGATLAAAVYIGALSVLQFALIVRLWQTYSESVLHFFRGWFA